MENHVTNSLEESVTRFLEEPKQGPQDWGDLAKIARMYGLDIRSFSSDILRTALASDDLSLELIHAKRAFLVKVTVTAVVCLGVRLYLRSQGENLVHSWIDWIFVILSAALAGVVVLVWCRRLPTLWTHDGDDPTGNRLFLAWCRVLILGVTSADSPGPIETVKRLCDLERRDGICRAAERKLLWLSWSDREFATARFRLRKALALLPVTELLVATVLGIGFCGIPVVDFIGGGATIDPVQLGDDYGLEKGHAFGDSTDQ